MNISERMTNKVVLSSVERQQQLLRFIEQRGRVTIADACEQFDISVATARRDIEALAERGAVQRFHGGALAIRAAPPEPPVLQRATDQAAEKRRIAAAAAALVNDGETIFLSSGTTAHEVARNLRGHTNLTIITNSLLVIDELLDVPGITLVGLGGMLRRSEMSLIGHITELSLAELRADKVILGIRAIDVEHGLTNDYLPETMTDRAILKIGREVIVLADHTKCGRSAAAFVAPISGMHTLITDSNTQQSFIDAVSERGVIVLVV